MIKAETKVPNFNGECQDPGGEQTKIKQQDHKTQRPEP